MGLGVAYLWPSGRAVFIRFNTDHIDASGREIIFYLRTTQVDAKFFGEAIDADAEA